MGGWINRGRFQRVTAIIIAQTLNLLFMTGDFLTGYDFSEPAWLF